MPSFVTSMFLYSCESGTFTAELEQRKAGLSDEMQLKGYQTFFARTMLPIKRFTERSKQPLKNMLNFSSLVKKRKLRVFGAERLV